VRAVRPRGAHHRRADPLSVRPAVLDVAPVVDAAVQARDPGFVGLRLDTNSMSCRRMSLPPGA